MAIYNWTGSLPNSDWLVNTWNSTSPSPVIVDDRVVFSMDDGFGGWWEDVEGVWRLNPDASGNMRIELDWSFDLSQNTQPNDVLFLINLSNSEQSLELDVAFSDNEGFTYFAPYLSNYGWVNDFRDFLPTATGKLRIELVDGSWYFKADVGSGFQTIFSYENSGDTTDFTVHIDASLGATPPAEVLYTPISLGPVKVNESDTPPPPPPPPNYAEGGKSKISASIAGGKTADVYVYTKNPCQCSLDLSTKTDNESLDLYKGPWGTQIIISAERAGYPAIETLVWCANGNSDIGTLAWDWRYLGIDFIAAEKVVVVNEISGVSQCRVEYFIDGLYSVYVEDGDGVARPEVGNFGASFTEKTVDLTTLFPEGTKLQVSYWAQGIAINYFTAKSAGTSDIQIQVETGKESPKYLTDKTSITVSDSTPTSTTTTTTPTTTPTNTPTINGPVYHKATTFFDYCLGTYTCTGDPPYTWSATGNGITYWVINQSNTSESASLIPNSRSCCVWVDGFHGGTLTISCKCKDKSGSEVTPSLTVTIRL